jgi:hypothetical protein
MEPNKNKSMWMWVLVAVLVVVAVVLLAMKMKTGDMSLETNEGAETAMDAEDQTSLPGAVEEKTKESTNTAKPTTLTYQQALEKYKDKRIQFDNSCASTPKTVTYKDNTGIMLDNRSSQTRTIKVGTAYTLKPYGFKIITLPNITTQKTFLVDCDNQQNVATILVQE